MQLYTLVRDMFKGGSDISKFNSKEIEYEQLLDGVQKLPILIFTNIFLGLITVIIMWGHISNILFIGWITMLSLSLFSRYLILSTYQKATVDTTPRWNIYVIMASFFTGITWGVAGLIIEIYVFDMHQEFVIFILGGMAAGSITTSTSIRWNYLAFMVPSLLLITIYYLLYNDGAHNVMGSMTLFFMLIMTIVSINFRKMQLERLITVKQLSHAQQRLKSITSSMGEGVYVIDQNGALEFMNAEAENILGWNFEEIKDSDLHTLVHVHPDDQQNECIVKKAYIDGKKYHSEDDYFKRKSGEIFPVSITAAPINMRDQVSGAVVIFRDITTRKRIEKQLTDLALHDKLTGLYNRGSFDDKLNYELERAHRYARELSLLMLDIDFFKKVNDTYGHQAGDTVLQTLANVITTSIRGSDYAARFGGEEFVIILPETQRIKAFELAERIRAVVADMVINISEDKSVHITVSIGVATSHNGISSDDLIKASDDALYTAKENGRNQVSI